MEQRAKEFFFQVLQTPSPSGYEGPLQQLVREYAGEFADQVRTDVHGNVIAVIGPDAPLRVMLAGHCDQIGLIVQHIDDDGARKPIHLLTDEERKQVPKLKDLWLDIGAGSKEEAQKMVRIGDAVTVKLSVSELPNQRAVAPGMDDKAGMWVVVEALRRVDRARLRCGLYAVATVQEELGLRGARTSSFGIDPHVGVAVDVTFATDCPTVEKKEEGDIRLGKGPVIYRGPNMNPHVVRRLLEAAENHKIPYQLAAAGKPTGTDANAMQINRAGVATGLVSIPNRYMHSAVEMVSLEDMDQAADLLARFAEGIEPEADFTPG